MEIGLIGLGKMGLNLALNMLDHEIGVKAYDISENAFKEAGEKGIKVFENLNDMISNVKTPRIIWIMVPAGKPVDAVIDKLQDIMDKDDIIVDGGNSNYKDTLRRSEAIKRHGIKFADVGTSGGISGARNGICAMVGCDDDVFQYLEPILKRIAVDNGYLHTGKTGTGHFVKMVHNGIEYGMMQAIAEGFEILNASGFDIKLDEVANLWNHGSVIRGWLMELMHDAFTKDNQLSDIKGVMHSSGEGLWTVQTALELGVPAPVITEALYLRYRSEQQDTFSGKVVAALRNEFGGHAVEKTGNT